MLLRAGMLLRNLRETPSASEQYEVQFRQQGQAEVLQDAGASQCDLAYARRDNCSEWLEVIEMILAMHFMHASSHTHLHTGRNALRESNMWREEFVCGC